MRRTILLAVIALLLAPPTVLPAADALKLNLVVISEPIHAADWYPTL